MIQVCRAALAQVKTAQHSEAPQMMLHTFMFMSDGSSLWYHGGTRKPVALIWSATGPAGTRSMGTGRGAAGVHAWTGRHWDAPPTVDAGVCVVGGGDGGGLGNRSNFDTTCGPAPGVGWLAWTGVSRAMEGEASRESGVSKKTKRKKTPAGRPRPV